MENAFVTVIEQLKGEFLTYLWDIFCSNPNDNDVFNYSVKMEREFETLKENVETNKETEILNSVKTISQYIDSLIEKFKDFTYCLRFDYLKEKFNLLFIPESKLIPEL